MLLFPVYLCNYTKSNYIPYDNRSSNSIKRSIDFKTIFLIIFFLWTMRTFLLVTTAVRFLKK